MTVKQFKNILDVVNGSYRVYITYVTYPPFENFEGLTKDMLSVEDPSQEKELYLVINVDTKEYTKNVEKEKIMSVNELREHLSTVDSNFPVIFYDDGMKITNELSIIDIVEIQEDNKLVLMCNYIKTPDYI